MIGQDGKTRRTVVWQASSLTLVSLLLGIPLGVAMGRWLWELLAGQLGVVSVPRIPVLTLALIVPGAIALANLVSLLPARAAARTAPALVLRTE